MDRVRDEEVRGKAGIEMELASGVNQRVLRWTWKIWMSTVYG